MIDLHTHILPGLDDGARDWDESLEMVRISVDDGVQSLAVTPHMLPDGAFANRTGQVLPLLDELKRRVADRGIPLELVAGGEIYISPQTPAGVRAGELLTYGSAGKFALLELPGSEVPPWVESVFFDLQVAGVLPVLAHPERNIAVMKDVDTLVTWVRRGLFLQVNARSLTGESGPKVQRAAEELLERRVVHLLASDTHGPLRRPPGLGKARSRAEAIAGRDVAEALVLQNPRRVLMGEPLLTWEPTAPPRRGILSRILRRA